MRLILYYMTRTVKNQIRKIFHTWVAVFILVCVLLGAVLGVGIGLAASLFEQEAPPEVEQPLPEEVLPPEEENPFEGIPAEMLVEAIATLVLAVVFTFSILGADKSANSIFLMADVNLLFAAPMTPQAVLTFRLVMQAGASILATIYMLFQLPNLILNAGLSALSALVILFAWFFLLVYSKLISVWLYTFSSSHPTFKKYLRPMVYAVLALVVGGGVLQIRGAENPIAAAVAYLCAPASRYIPVIGWFKALLFYAASAKALPTLAALGALLLGVVAVVLLIRRTKADFYEDAMARSAEMAETAQAAQEGNMVRRKKERGDKLLRDRLDHGSGASVYFYKTLYNRIRFAHLRILTKTTETDLIVAVGLALFLRFTTDVRAFAPVALVLAALTFFRALGNPIGADVEKESFFLVPDSAHKKIFFSFLGGAVNSALDLLPAFFISGLVLGAFLPEVLLWYLLAIAVGVYSDSVGVFISLSLPTGIAKNLRTLIQVTFVYFGLAPVAVLMFIGFALQATLLFAGLTTLVCLGIAALFLSLSPLFILNGRK